MLTQTQQTVNQKDVKAIKFLFDLEINEYIYTYIYIYICMYVCIN